VNAEDEPGRLNRARTRGSSSARRTRR
jgi:hypothetical protein